MPLVPLRLGDRLGIATNDQLLLLLQLLLLRLLLLLLPLLLLLLRLQCCRYFCAGVAAAVLLDCIPVAL